MQMKNPAEFSMIDNYISCPDLHAFSSRSPVKAEQYDKWIYLLMYLPNTNQTFAYPNQTIFHWLSATCVHSFLFGYRVIFHWLALGLALGLSLVITGWHWVRHQHVGIGITNPLCWGPYPTRTTNRSRFVLQMNIGYTV